MKTTYRTAIHDAMRDALRDDPRVVLMGEDVGRYGGTYAASKGLLEEFGPERVRDTPLSELGFVGVGIGAALGGLRPIVEVMTVNFSLLALDQIVNTAAALRHMSGGQFSVPLVVRMATGAGRQLAAQHSHSLECLVRPHSRHQGAGPGDGGRRVRHAGPALADPDPVVIFEHVQLYNTATDVDSLTADRYLSCRDPPRRNPTSRLITYGGCLPKTLDAANELSLAGIDCEVIDLRVLAAVGHRHDHRIGAQDTPRRDCRRSLAHRQSGRRNQRAHRRERVLRPRRADRTGLQRPKCRYRTPSTSNRPHCRSRTRSSPP